MVPPYGARPLRLHPFRSLMLAPTLIGDPRAFRAFARPYRDVAERLLAWIAEGRMSEDDREAVYVHEYNSAGLSVRGVVATMPIEPVDDGTSAAVLPHEAVHSHQVKDLAERMQEMALNPAPILMIHHPAGDDHLTTWIEGVTRRGTELSFHDFAGQHHRIWAEKDPAQWAALNEALQGSEAIIADGHHRYAAYHEMTRMTSAPGWHDGLVMLVDQSATPLHLGAIHRVLHETTLADLKESAAAAGAIVATAHRTSALAELGPTTAVATEGEEWLWMRQPDGESSLVEWVHAELIRRLPARVTVSHHHSVASALSAATTSAPALLLPALSYPQLTHTLHAGRVLPEKATSFQPKPAIGVIMRRVPS